MSPADDQAAEVARLRALLRRGLLVAKDGIADVVVVWRARNRGSGGRPWAGQMLAEVDKLLEGVFESSRWTG